MSKRKKPQGATVEAKLLTYQFRVLLRWLHRRGVLDLVIDGRPTVRPEGGMIYVCNHLSYVDALIFWGSLLGQVVVVTMQQLWWLPFRWLPLMGIMLDRLGFIPVGRDKALRAKVTPRALAALAAGCSVAIFPSGKRLDPNAPITVHPGAVRMSRESGVPIRVLALSGVERVMPIGSARINRSEPVVLQFGTTLDPANYTGSDGEERMIDALRDAMEACYAAAKVRRAYEEALRSQLGR